MNTWHEKELRPPGGFRAAARRLGAVAVLLPALAAPSAWAQAPVWAATVSNKPLQELAEGARCGSVVIRHCRLRRETASMVLDPALRGRNGAPMQWEVVQFGGPDSDEIVITGERIRDPAVEEVFSRNFGPSSRGSALLTRPGLGGSRCTVVPSTGASVCSNSGGESRAVDGRLADWSDWTF
jgi:hypothetical protein